jgi:DNA-binding CsgD family transcriptional regulator
MSNKDRLLALPGAAETSASSAAEPGLPLLGRTREIDALHRLAQGASAATGGALVLRGEAGAGKTALLGEFAQFTQECRVVRLAGVQAEADMPWAVLHRLLLSFPVEHDLLADEQREAVDAAVAIHGARADTGLVESGIQAVLAHAAAQASLVCIIDDLQWIDDASLAVLHAIARRSSEIPLTLLAAVREPAPSPALAGVPELAVAGLAAEAAADLLIRHAGAVLDRRTAKQLARPADGNPLTLSEAGRRLAGGQADVIDILNGQRLAGLPLPSSFAAEIRALPEPTQALLVLAACDTGDDTRRLWRAASLLELGPEMLAPARRANVVRPGPGVVFRHCLLRAAAIECASPRQWLSSHQALAAACDQRTGPAAVVWHRAAAAAAPEDEIAAELAHHAQQHAGDLGALRGACWLAEAARLSGTEATAATRYLAAGSAALAAGAPQLAEDLLRRARQAWGSSTEQASAQRLAARLTAVLGRPSGEASHQMVAAAAQLAGRDPQAGLEAMQEAVQLAISAGHYARQTVLPAIGSALLGLNLGLNEDEMPAGALLPGLAKLLGGDYRRAVPLLRQALGSARSIWNSLPGAGAAQVYAARALWDDEHLLAWCKPAKRPAARDHVPAPSSHELAATLAAWSAALACTGHLDEAEWMAGQARRLARTLGWSQVLLATLDGAELHAWRGDGPATERAAVRQAAAAVELERADIENSAAAALMTLHLSRCQYAAAFAAAESLSAEDRGGYANQALPVLVEAGARLGRLDAAQRALAELKTRATASGTAWALGVLSLCEALLAGDGEAAGAYERSVALLDTTGIISERARARLLYGEWLRRQRQRVAARGWLSAACQLFRQAGAAEFAARAQRELDATVPPRQVPPRQLPPRQVPPRHPSGSPIPASPGLGLTLAERRIAERAAAGATNKEIAAELFVSRRTVDHHLRNTYGKLGVSSRRQLRAALQAIGSGHSGSRP